ncbi:MAG: methyltransferase domain-containing protein [Propionibacteriales bacterium]|nr:methyltransferase domain-containing protein [Propionibacteriales bacterium]
MSESDATGGRARGQSFTVRLIQDDAGVSQGEEWCEVEYEGRVRRIRFHDYAEIFSIPGLYERLFYDVLECASPRTVGALVAEDLERLGYDAGKLRVLDVGAGNGMVAEEFARLGASEIVGIDILPEARLAAMRDRPDVYDDYLVADLTDMPHPVRETLRARRFNCLTVVAALGFGDIPPLAFVEAYNLVEPQGWVAFTIKEEFLGGHDDTGFARLIRQMLDSGVLRLHSQRRYRHRLLVTGEPLYYVAMVGSRREPVPASWAEAGGS